VTQKRLLASAVGFLVVAAAFVTTQQLAPRGLPFGIIVIGLLVGGLNGLVAMGLVLVYRAGSYVNFAQGGIGAAGALVAVKLITIEHLPYVVAVAAGLVVSALAALLAERAIIRRLFTAPRLIVTVATIGAAQFFGGLQALIEASWKDPLHVAPRLTVPWNVSLHVGAVTLHGEHLVALMAIPVVAAAAVLLVLVGREHGVERERAGVDPVGGHLDMGGGRGREGQECGRRKRECAHEHSS